MSLQIASINSGSNGNCYYVGNSKTAVLIDVGISGREVEKRMKKIGLNIKNVKAIFISHEHTDHVKGLAGLAHKHYIPIYITNETAKNIHLIKHLSRPFFADTPIQIEDLTITPFSKNHDAADPHSFNISYNNITVGVYTDIGCVCSNVIKYFKECNAVFLEANYDDEMLAKGNYPQHLKNRISSNVGHLSNEDALNLFVNHRKENLTHLLLSHISKENNDVQLVKDLFEKNSTNIEIIIADRYSASNVYDINGSSITQVAKPQQMALF